MSNQSGIVYKIENTKTGQVYIGCTNFSLGRRLSQHLRCAGVIDTPLYHDLDSDITNFIFSVLECDIPLNCLRERESAWIQDYDSVNTGYNQVSVSGNEKLGIQLVTELQSLLLSTDMKFKDIADMYEVSETVISDINRGKTWFSETFIYPLRRKTVKRKKLTENEVHQIYDQLRDISLSFQDIASSWGWESQAVLRKINNETYRISPLSKEAYPVRPVDSRKGKRK
ncbi:GIY-YIG nuclease family protein [Spirulina major]|uniref:GIY-YIG nuclease family protein n=1 Tax=Spirulina major TaxID=270636 RepID=UPI000934C458|nr:GIY-YIG nuclease family protein [Spirulina major]